MNETIERLKILDKNKDDIIKKINELKPEKFSKSQAQNLLAYSIQTNSVNEVLLFLEYQMAKDTKREGGKKELSDDEKKLIENWKDLKLLVEDYKGSSIEVIRYLLGMFTRRLVIVQHSGV